MIGTYSIDLRANPKLLDTSSSECTSVIVVSQDGITLESAWKGRFDCKFACVPCNIGVFSIFLRSFICFGPFLTDATLAMDRAATVSGVPLLDQQSFHVISSFEATGLLGLSIDPRNTAPLKVTHRLGERLTSTCSPTQDENRPQTSFGQTALSVCN